MGLGSPRVRLRECQGLRHDIGGRVEAGSKTFFGKLVCKNPRAMGYRPLVAAVGSTWKVESR